MKVDMILSNGTVVTMNEDLEIFSEGVVAMKDGQIAAVGPAVGPGDLVGVDAQPLVGLGGLEQAGVEAVAGGVVARAHEEHPPVGKQRAGNCRRIC